MKHILLFTALLIAGTANAQIPNNGFESWTSSGNYDIPDGCWSVPNEGGSESYHPVTKSTDHYPVDEGNYSIRFENNIILLPCTASLGLAATAKQAYYFPGPAFAITGHPEEFCGYYKFFPQNNDTMLLQLQLYLNGNVVATASLTGTASVSLWTSFVIPISQYITADSASITLAGYNAFNPIYQSPHVPHGNSVLYVDNLSFDNLILSGFHEPNSKNLLSIYPNPSEGKFTVSSGQLAQKIEVYDLFGRKVLESKGQEIDMSNYPAGLYIWRVGEARGKLVIE